jgi:predicted TIM-barrel fold metal-dependent hydrolase
MIIDAHAHIFSAINGQNRYGATASGSRGMVSTGLGLKQMLPPYLKDSSFPVETLIGLMDKNGVDRAILLQNPTFGIINDEIMEAIGKYPDRFIGTVQIDPMNSSGAMELMGRYSNVNQKILKLEMSDTWGWTGIYPGLQFDSPPVIKIIESAYVKGFNVIVDPGPVGNEGYQVEVIEKFANRFPQMIFLIEHLGYLCKEDLGNQALLERRLQCIKLAHLENVFLGFSATGILLDDEYPCPRSLSLLKEAVNLVGSDKILWGSDIPTTLKMYTYRQMIDVIKKASFLSEDDKKLILGGNALRIFWS